MMVNLSKEQQSALDGLESARLTYDRAIGSLDAQYEYQKEQLKIPVRNAVGQAEARKIPVRRIHMALGFGQVSQLYAFLRPPKGSLAAIGSSTNYFDSSAAQQTAVEPFTLAFDEKYPDEFIRGTFADGNEFTVVFDMEFGPSGNEKIVRRDKWAQSEDGEAIEKAVSAMLAKEYPNVQFTWIDRSI